MKLGLGTVQFGVDYGISNPAGRTPPEEVGRVLDLAVSIGVQVLDTAPLYGSSEEVLGRCLKRDHGFRIVTKTVKFPSPVLDDADAETLDSAFHRSLSLLKAD